MRRLRCSSIHHSSQLMLMINQTRAWQLNKITREKQACSNQTPVLDHQVTHNSRVNTIKSVIKYVYCSADKKSQSDSHSLDSDKSSSEKVSSSISSSSFRHPTTRTELASYYLHFIGPKPFYKTYSYV